MEFRRSNQKPSDSTPRGNRPVHVPARPAVSAQRTGIGTTSSQPNPDEAPIPLLDTKDEDAVKTVDINITFPSVPKPPVRKVISDTARFTKSHRRLSVVGLVLLLGLGVYNFGPFNKTPDSTKHGVAGVKTEKLSQKPDYATILPEGKKIEDFGGWKRVSPPDRNPVFAYPDKVDDITLAVSEQPLPENLKAEPKLVEDLAKSYNATEKVTVDGHIAYIGTSAKGPQSVIFTKNDLLILIKSTNKLTTDQWVAYISSLQ